MTSINPYLLITFGLLFIFLMTTAGAACVFFVRKNLSLSFKRIFLGFAAGVMTAASIWSLLLPAMEQAEAIGNIPWVPATIGFILGGLFLLLIDKIIPHIHMDSKDPEGPPSSFKRQTLLYLAVAIHNIPEGLAVGLAFGLALKNSGDVGLMAVAVGLALGIGLQNFPEGAAISLPMKEEGSTKRRSFLYGMASGAVEPIFGLLGVFLAAVLTPIMPWDLAFAAGAMIFVVVEELIPEARLGEHSHMGTFGFMAGFIIMMILDVAFG